MNIFNGYPITSFNGIDVNTSLPCDSRNYYGYSNRSVKYIVIHYTGNKADTAKANADYFSGGSRGASAHYFVDDNSCYQSVALNNAAWAVGGTSKYKHSECRNSNSISIEMCCFKDYMVSEKTEINAAYLCAALCRYIGITADTVDTYVIRHWDVWAKDCPSGWTGSNNSRWNGFKERVKSILKGESEDLTMAQYEELKSMINAQAAEIAALQETNTKLMNVIESTFIYNYNDNNVPDWARDALTAAMKCGAVQGDDGGKLNLCYKDLRTIVREYRCGMYAD